MDIYILRDGKEIGPFNEETIKTLLQQGSILETDYAWHPGLPKWLPLATVLKPVPPPLDMPPPPPVESRTELPTFASPAQPAASAEPASDKQKALLKYLGIPYTSTLTKDQAALLVNETMEDPKKAGLLVKWNTDRLKLRPDLFAAEVQEQKEARAGEYFEICQTEGAEYFTKITKAHCQVLIGFLDGKFPHWDEDAHTAPKNYFFPAVAEKFPQLIAREWKGKLHYATPAAGADEKTGKPPTGKLRKRNSQQGFPLTTVARGAVFAVVAVGMFLFVKRLNSPEPAKPSAPAPKPARQQAESPLAPAPLAPDPAPQKAEGALPDQVVAQVDPFAPPADPLAPAPPATPADPADPARDPKMATDPATPKPGEPVPGFPPDPLAPAPAPAPGEPPAPAPTTPPPADPFAPTPSPAPGPTTPPPATPAEPAVAKGILKLTKPVEVQLAYGKMKLPAGTSVKFISHEGPVVKVSYLNTVLTIPASSTDLGVPENPNP